MKYFEKKSKKIYCRTLVAFINGDFSRKVALSGLIPPNTPKLKKLNLLSDFLGVSPRTCQRWYNNELAPHPSAENLLLNYLKGLPQHKQWSGWRIEADNLIAPNGDTFNENDLRKRWLLHNRIRFLEGENSKLKRHNSQLQHKINRLDNGELARQLREARTLLEQAGKLFDTSLDKTQSA